MEDGVKGCLALVSIALVVIVLLVGGVYRTEVTYTPGNLGNVGAEVPFEEDLTAR
jgi:hypothetical protein